MVVTRHNHGYMGNGEASIVRKVFTASEYGQTLSKEVRFGKFKPVDISNGEWVALLGRDVSNLEHMTLTHGIARMLTRHIREHQPNLLTGDQLSLVELLAQGHDMAEAITTDISFEDKKLSHEHAEKIAFKQIVEELFGEHPEIQAKLLNNVEVIFTHEGPMINQVFNAVERLGYLRTALNATKYINDESLPHSVRTGMEDLLMNVFSNQIIPILNHAKKIDAVDAAVMAHIEPTREAFELLFAEPDVFLRANEQAQTKLTMVLNAYEAWSKKVSS